MLYLSSKCRMRHNTYKCRPKVRTSPMSGHGGILTQLRGSAKINPVGVVLIADAAAAPLLALDDVRQANFTAAWISSLFDLLETRLSHHKATIWTSQMTVYQLRQKIERQNGNDCDQAAAICRRLEQHSLVIATR
jgi:DNA replication protein DnaC